MRKVIKRYIEGYWWAFFLQSLIALGFGIFALVTPERTLSTLVLIAALTILLIGVIELIRGIMSAKKRAGWVLSIVVALINICVGIFLIINKDSAFNLVTAVIAAFIIVRGIFDLILGFLSLNDPTDRFMWIVAGIAGVVLGILILNYPYTSSIAMILIFGTYCLIFGLTNVIYSIHVRSMMTKAKGKLESKSKTKK